MSNLSHDNQNNHQNNVSQMDGKTLIMLTNKIINGLFNTDKIITASEHKQILQQIAKDCNLFLEANKSNDDFDQVEFANKSYNDFSKQLFDDII
jgi:hypothetical protein